MNKKKIKEEAYRLAKAKYWARNPPPLKEAGERYPRREELHERKVFVDTNVVSKQKRADDLVGLGYGNLKEFYQSADGAGGRKKIISKVLDRGEGIVYI